MTGTVMTPSKKFDHSYLRPVSLYVEVPAVRPASEETSCLNFPDLLMSDVSNGSLSS